MSKLVKFMEGKKGMELMKLYASTRDESIVLPKGLKEHFHNLELLHDWYVQFRDQKAAIEYYMIRMKDRGEPIHLATAYRHFKEMKEVMCVRDKIDKNYERIFLIGWIKKRMIVADRMDDNRGFAALLKELREILQLDKEEIPEHLLQEPIPYLIGNFPEEEGATAMTQKEAEEFEKKFRDKVSKKINGEATDTEYEDV